MLFQTDEIDGMLQSINKAKDARHENIMGTLLTIYSAANSVFPMRRKAGKESPGVIDQPCLVAVRHGHPEPLLRGALGADAHERVLRPHDRPGVRPSRPPGRSRGLLPLPARVLGDRQWWADFRPGTGNLEDWHPVRASSRRPRARQILIETRLEAEAEYDAAEAAGDDAGGRPSGAASASMPGSSP